MSFLGILLQNSIFPLYIKVFRIQHQTLLLQIDKTQSSTTVLHNTYHIVDSTHVHCCHRTDRH